MDLAVSLLYPDDKPYDLAIFDTRIPGVAERFHRERAAGGEEGEVEMLDLDHPVLIVRPNGAREERR